MRRRREEHDAAHRRRHLRGQRAHERKLRGFAASLREPREGCAEIVKFGSLDSLHSLGMTGSHIHES